MKIGTSGPWFRDEFGRAVMLRGVNLSGSSKVPATPNGATHLNEGFYEHRTVSFVGRPFPLAEADEHLLRLKKWGFNFLRFLVTWEAIEHAGPGLYDEEYLDYLYKVIAKAGEHGFWVLIDPHQDVWSRFSGGDGAPGWTLEAVGLEISKLHEAAAAILHQVHGDPFPHMIWPTNGTRLAAATMFTLFFAGNDFAPHTLVEGEPVQEYLQRHYVQAFQEVARRLRSLDCVIGYEMMNEPLSGFIGIRDLVRPTLPVKFGPLVSPLQSMLLGSGIPQEIEIWRRTLINSRLAERTLMNPSRMRIWREGYTGVWCQNGVWNLDEKGFPQLLRPHHFSTMNGQSVNFSEAYLRPLANRFAKAIRAIQPDALIFLETDPRMPPPQWGPGDAQNIVYAPHWYDATVLFLKTYSPWIGFDVHAGRVVLGRFRVQHSFVRQLARHKEYAQRFLNNAPTLIGEIGIAFDLNHRHAYHTGDYRQQVRAMDRSLRAAEENLLSLALWNYTPDNDHAHGDQWNGEDLSIYCRDGADPAGDVYAGGRALQAVIRPYPRATAGVPLRLSFDINRRIFQFEFRQDPTITTPTEIFVPNFQYPMGYNVTISDGNHEIDQEGQLLFYQPGKKEGVHRIYITPKN